MIQVDTTGRGMTLREETNVYTCEDGSTVTVHRSYPKPAATLPVLSASGDPGGTWRLLTRRKKPSRSQKRAPRRRAAKRPPKR
jgi:hypothetical protein